jgi:hypothetical protein
LSKNACYGRQHFIHQKEGEEKCGIKILVEHGTPGPSVPSCGGMAEPADKANHPVGDSACAIHLYKGKNGTEGMVWNCQYTMHGFYAMSDK